MKNHGGLKRKMNDLKIVNYEEYCPTCKHYEDVEIEDPCDECLANPVNLDSRKPINYSQKEQDS